MFTQYTKFLTEEQRQMVHEASMEVLENTGMLVKAECAREIFKEHGCTVQDDGIVKIPHEVIEKYIKMFPSSYTFTAQDPQYDITIPEQGPCVVTASSRPGTASTGYSNSWPCSSLKSSRASLMSCGLSPFDVDSSSREASTSRP